MHYNLERGNLISGAKEGLLRKKRAWNEGPTAGKGWVLESWEGKAPNSRLWVLADGTEGNLTGNPGRDSSFSIGGAGGEAMLPISACTYGETGLKSSKARPMVPGLGAEGARVRKLRGRGPLARVSGGRGGGRGTLITQPRQRKVPTRR